MSETSLHNLSDPSSHLKKGQNENRANLKKTVVKKVKTDKISENRGPTIICPKRIYESTVKRMFHRAIAIY